MTGWYVLRALAAPAGISLAVAGILWLRDHPVTDDRVALAAWPVALAGLVAFVVTG